MREIKNNKLFRQRIFWGDLDYNGLTFSDIDACMNFYEKIIIFIEVKRSGKEVFDAQKRMFETISRNLKIDSIIICAWHNENDSTKNVQLKNCLVHKYFYNGEWKTKVNKNLGEFLTEITQYYYKKPL